MKNLKILIVFALLFACNKKSIKAEEFTEQDAYDIINTHIKEHLYSYEGDSLVLWNNRQLKELDTKLIETPFVDLIPTSNPIFSKKHWKMEKVNGVKAVDWKEYSSFFKENYSTDMKALWNKKFHNKYVHNVSFPIYNVEKQIAVIRDFPFRPNLICITGLNNLYYYKKTDNGWISFEIY